ncbi:MAG: hypothetical protein HOP17_02220 [Acidobacteria bacterium]|nr:hypothetical protein [Acidobacteriota bacterium]
MTADQFGIVPAVAKIASIIVITADPIVASVVILLLPNLGIPDLVLLLQFPLSLPFGRVLLGLGFSDLFRTDRLLLGTTSAKFFLLLLGTPVVVLLGLTLTKLFLLSRPAVSLVIVLLLANLRISYLLLPDLLLTNLLLTLSRCPNLLIVLDISLRPYRRRAFGANGFVLLRAYTLLGFLFLLLLLRLFAAVTSTLGIRIGAQANYNRRSGNRADS